MELIVDDLVISKMFQYFFINYTKKHIRFAGGNYVLQDIAYYLKKACELHSWEMTDKVEVFDAIRQRNIVGNCASLIMIEGYECEQNFLEFFVGQET